MKMLKNVAQDPLPQNVPTSAVKILSSEKGAVGYLIAWLLGVPVSILAMVFLLRAIF